MTEVWKFQIDGPKVRVFMPKGAKILCAHNQKENICLWAEVTPGEKVEERIIEVFGTGHNIMQKTGAERKYIGTVMLDDGALVFHVYERIS